MMSKGTKMSNKHNKRRNTGLLYEFLVRTISQALVEGDQKRSSTALRLIKKHFKQGTELYKEYRLINALMKSTVSSQAVASSILTEAKSAARSYDVSKLDKEKSLLIAAINRSINNELFYDQPVNEYKMYATIQTLLNDWRTSDDKRDIQRLAKYENSLVEWLQSQKSEQNDEIVTVENVGTNRLLMKTMMKKLNEKYNKVLIPEQKELIRAYAFSTASNDVASVKLKLQELKERLFAEIDRYVSENVHDSYINSKLTEVKGMIQNETMDVIDDNLVTRFMLYTKLNSELIGTEKKDV